ncbi:indoleamine 2,3-dioxygenase [Natrononativus amylolyticus]|uniref:indoleamine 2,3-dioxygenase n=1 Tax=Natrononativus amylolyticus TaxID=2963434 RepID=UPI0020CEA211|nr:indoleamine 2,3-dioxygenase [Natrononativus amylolyticus]
MDHTSGAVLSAYGIDERRGFLPEEDPLTRFEPAGDGAVDAYLRRLDEFGERLPSLLAEGELRPLVEDLETPPDGLLEGLSDRETVRLCLLSGFLASGYVNRIGADPVDRLPAGVAVPLYRSSRRLGRKPILSYDLLCLHNFRRRDPDGGLVLGNLETVQQFTDLADERWFVVVHVAIEAAAGPALVACARAQAAIRGDDPTALEAALETIADSLERQTSIMRRMTEENEPTAFATEYRPYYNGFDELVYEGVGELEGAQTYRGGSGAQSCALPSIDATLGIEHETTELIEKLLDMRTYMPEKHRSVVEAFDADVDVRPYVAAQGDDELSAAFNRCIEALQTFRLVHFGQVIQYIRAVTGETTGTGGTDYMSFLGEMEDETGTHKV